MNRIYEKPPEWRTERARNASKASHSVEAIAAKLVRDLPTATPEQQHVVRAMLRRSLCGRRSGGPAANETKPPLGGGGSR